MSRFRVRLRPLSESEAYHRCHGERIADVRIVHLEPRRPRYEPRVTGEELRSAFERRLAEREREEAEAHLAVQPPSTGKTTPVTKREPSPAKKSAAATTSSARPG
jgi:hypothetical protein